MELAYYRLIFDNQQEYLVETEFNETEGFVRKMGKNEFITLQLTKESEPVYLKSNRVFSVQRAKEGSMSTQTKKWRML